jgi:hypothetical protein
VAFAVRAEVIGASGPQLDTGVIEVTFVDDLFYAFTYITH